MNDLYILIDEAYHSLTVRAFVCVCVRVCLRVWAEGLPLSISKGFFFGMKMSMNEYEWVY